MHGTIDNKQPVMTFGHCCGLTARAYSDTLFECVLPAIQYNRHAGHLVASPQLQQVDLGKEDNHGFRVVQERGQLLDALPLGIQVHLRSESDTHTH
jgi:hypothetical protein